MDIGELLISVTLNNNFDKVVDILENYPDLINYQNARTGITALMAAVGSGNMKMSRMLISQPGINLHIRDFSGRMALEHARTFPEIMSILAAKMHPNWSELKHRNFEPK